MPFLSSIMAHMQWLACSGSACSCSHHVLPAPIERSSPVNTTGYESLLVSNDFPDPGAAAAIVAHVQSLATDLQATQSTLQQLRRAQAVMITHLITTTNRIRAWEQSEAQIQDDIRMRKNLLNPIRRLPSEVLENIFSQSLQRYAMPQPHLSRYKWSAACTFAPPHNPLWALGTTCARWRREVLSHQHLWAYISIDIRNRNMSKSRYFACLATHLGRAGLAPLHVTIGLGSLDTDADNINISDFDDNSIHGDGAGGVEVGRETDSGQGENKDDEDEARDGDDEDEDKDGDDEDEDGDDEDEEEDEDDEDWDNEDVGTDEDEEDEEEEDSLDTDTDTSNGSDDDVPFDVALIALSERLVYALLPVAERIRQLDLFLPSRIVNDLGRSPLRGMMLNLTNLEILFSDETSERMDIKLLDGPKLTRTRWVNIPHCREIWTQPAKFALRQTEIIIEDERISGCSVDWDAASSASEVDILDILEAYTSLRYLKIDIGRDETWDDTEECSKHETSLTDLDLSAFVWSSKYVDHISAAELERLRVAMVERMPCANPDDKDQRDALPSIVEFLTRSKPPIQTIHLQNITANSPSLRQLFDFATTLTELHVIDYPELQEAINLIGTPIYPLQSLRTLELCGHLQSCMLLATRIIDMWERTSLSDLSVHWKVVEGNDGVVVDRMADLLDMRRRLAHLPMKRLELVAP